MASIVTLVPRAEIAENRWRWTHQIRWPTAASRACWYIGFWSAEEGRYATRKAATALIAELGPRGAHLARSAHTRAAAEEAAKLYSPVAATDSIAVYLERFWLPDGDYARARAARGHQLSAEYLANSHAAIVRHVLPHLRHRHIATLSPEVLETMLEMLDRYTSVTDEQRRAAARIAGRILEKG